MTPLNLFRLQLMDTFTGSARLTVRFGVTILLALPFIFIDLPMPAKSSGLVMVIMFTTFFGSAIAHARLCEDGRFTRLRLLPISRPILWLDLVLASAINRMIPAAILLTGFIIINGPTVSFVFLIYIAFELCATVVLLVISATLLGHAARSNGQVHLFAALVCACIAFISGVIPTAPKLASVTAALAANPLYQLRNALSGMTNETLTISSLKFIMSCIILAVFALVIVLRWNTGTIGNKQLT